MTRDTYIPRLTTSVTQIASGVASRSSPVEYDDFGTPLSFPKGTTFTIFPSYTRPVSKEESELGQAGYIVSVRGWMWCPGLMTRKNRLILSLAKQIIKFKGDDAAKSAVDRLNQDPSLLQDSLKGSDESDTQSVMSASTSSTSTSTRTDPNSADSLIKERLSSFIARSITNAELTLTIGALDATETTPLVELTIFTDANGHFDRDIFVPYHPSVLQVRSNVDDTVCAFQEVSVVSSSGYGVISDIDDTVKLTGVIGDKRELMYRLLVEDISTWNIPPVVQWYQKLLSHSEVTFHYVSNSPWQLFSLIEQYFHFVQLPKGSFHLKQYTGNIISSLMEPSSSRKRTALLKLMNDFRNKIFVCIGDSGEQDLEAYTDIAKSYPGRIKSIYIRVVPNSLSNVDDSRILKEIRSMVESWNERQATKPQPPAEAKTEMADLIDLTDDKRNPAAVERLSRLPPMIPKKPTSLQGAQLKRPPPLPERKYLQPTEFNHSATSTFSGTSSGSVLPPSEGKPVSVNTNGAPPPPPPPRRKTVMVANEALQVPDAESQPKEEFTSNLQYIQGIDDFYELEDVDPKGASWVLRLTTVLHALDGTNTKLHFFEDGDEKFFETSLEDLDKLH